MPFVVDASAALAWCFADEATPATDRLLQSLAQDYAVAPSIWPSEIANALLMASKRGRASSQDTDAHLLDLLLLPIRVENAPDAVVMGVTTALARAHNLTIYDGLYLELALRLNLPIATLDDDLTAAARAERAKLALPRNP